MTPPSSATIPAAPSGAAATRFASVNASSDASVRARAHPGPRVAAQPAARPEHGDGQQHGGGEQERAAEDEADGGGHGSSVMRSGDVRPSDGWPTPVQGFRLRRYPDGMARELLLA